MAFVTKTWKDRLVEYAGRRKLKNVATGEEILMDVSRSEGTVNQAGDAFSAANMNNLEQRIKTEFDSVNSSLTDQPTFEYDESGKITGYKTKIGGADTVFPFKNGADVVWTNPSPNTEMKSAITVNFDFTKYSHIAISLKGHYSQSNNSLETQLFSTLHSGGSLRPTSTNQNYSRTMTFDKSNNKITIKPNTSAGNYESYTIPIRIWGLNIDADFSSI